MEDVTIGNGRPVVAELEGVDKQNGTADMAVHDGVVEKAGTETVPVAEQPSLASTSTPTASADKPPLHPHPPFPTHHPTPDTGSRFHIKRRLLIGNVSRYIPEDKRPPHLARYPYKWMIYLRGPPGEEDVTTFVRKVRFYLHPDYRPFDVVEVKEWPFNLTRYGWGEFPVRVEVWFVDGRNKRCGVVHVVK
ncbi:YEATS domain-containing protein 2, partial [Rhizophlyctis rosea]